MYWYSNHKKKLYKLCPYCTILSIILLWFVLTDTITPLFITKKEESNFYEKTYIMIPLCFGIVAFLILIIAVLLYMRRRRELIQMKGKVKFTIPGDVYQVSYVLTIFHPHLFKEEENRCKCFLLYLSEHKKLNAGLKSKYSVISN